MLTVVAVAFGWDIRAVGDMGAMPHALPVFLIPDIPLTLELLAIILPYAAAAAVAVVGRLESPMTQNIVDALTDTTSNRNRARWTSCWRIERIGPMTDRLIALGDASIYAQSVCDHAAWAASPHPARGRAQTRVTCTTPAPCPGVARHAGVPR